MKALFLAALVLGSAATARPMGEASDRCLQYGFRDQQKLARCTEIELRYPEPKHWSLKQNNRASNQCLRLGFTGETRGEYGQDGEETLRSVNADAPIRKVPGARSPFGGHIT